MDVRLVDTVATSGRSALHAASPRTKIAVAALTIAAAAITTNVLVCLAVAVATVAAAVAARIPMRPYLALAGYPAVFAALFAWASAPDVLSGALIVTKAVTAALAVVLVLFTTPYPQVFASIQRALPGLVGDALFMTYRAIFILGDKLDDLVVAARLRSGAGRHPVRSARATVRALGNLVLYAFDLAEREYDVLALRGYSGRLTVPVRRSAAPAADAVLAVAGLAAIAASVAWRIAWRDLVPYSWMPLALSLALLAAVLVLRAASKEGASR
jgi:energy-coupling factor transporter transmembrane protein EcfT